MCKSAIAPRIMKPWSHYAFCPKGTVAQSSERHKQSKVFCISKLIALHAIATSLSRLHGIKDRLIGNANKYLMAVSWPTIQDKRVQSEASPTRDRIQQLLMVNAASNSGIKLKNGIMCLYFTLG